MAICALLSVFPCFSRPCRDLQAALLCCDHLEEGAEHLFQLACKRDLEGSVAKRKFDPYLLGNAKCYKIRNRNCSQRARGEEL